MINSLHYRGLQFEYPDQWFSTLGAIMELLQKRLINMHVQSLSLEFPVHVFQNGACAFAHVYVCVCVYIYKMLLKIMKNTKTVAFHSLLKLHIDFTNP